MIDKAEVIEIINWLADPADQMRYAEVVALLRKELEEANVARMHYFNQALALQNALENERARADALQDRVQELLNEVMSLEQTP